MSKEVKDKKREENINNLFDSTVEVASIECTKCDKVETGFTLACNLLYNDGWRATRNNVYCPDCAKKFKIK
jgi:hypothetical protein